MKHRTAPAPIRSLACLLLVALAAGAAAAQDGYGFYRSVEGYAELTQSSGEQERVEINLPLLPGDIVDLLPSARVEAVLPDGARVRIGGATRLAFERLAGSAYSADPATVLALDHGVIQVTRNAAAGVGLLTVETISGSIGLAAPGSYRIDSDGVTAEVQVRVGSAEAVSRSGAVTVSAGQAARLAGNGIERVAAAAPDELERWAEALETDALRADTAVDPALDYAAAPLAAHGEWVSYEDRSAWRPRVDPGWQPYTHGYWTYLPGGITWVSAEPWGWVTYHYGYWDMLPGYGWAWFPGLRYSPAWVYWYWGPTHVAWVPVGYYDSFYGLHGNPWRFGVYGYAGGSWGAFSQWSFCPIRSFGRRDLPAHVTRGHDLAARGLLREVPRGIIATDTRPITPDRWGKPHDIEQTLKRAVTRPGSSADLPDVSSFVARRPDPDGTVRRAVNPVVQPGVAGHPGGTIDARSSLGRALAGRTPAGVAPVAPGVAVAPGRVATPRSPAQLDVTGRPVTVSPGDAESRLPVVRRVLDGIRSQRTLPTPGPSGTAVTQPGVVGARPLPVAPGAPGVAPSVSPSAPTPVSPGTVSPPASASPPQRVAPAPRASSPPAKGGDSDSASSSDRGRATRSRGRRGD